MKKKLLIIEDDANTLYSLKAKFSINDFEVEVSSGAEDSEEIIKKIKKIKSNYIILDLILPKVNGFDILSKIRADNEISKIPIFIFTNLTDEDSKIRSKNLGSDYYFIKSDFTIDEFVEKVKKIIENKEKPSPEAFGTMEGK